MLATVLAAAPEAGTPIWAYFLGAAGSAAAVIFGSWTLYVRIRQERDKEVKERVENTAATKENTRAIESFTARLDVFIQQTEQRFREHGERLEAHQRELDDHNRQLDYLSDRRPRGDRER